MKKILFVLPALLLIGACAKEPASELSSINLSESVESGQTPSFYTAKLTKSNSGLTTDDSTEAIQTEIASDQDATVKYKFEIGAPCYQHSKFDEFIVKQGAYIKSVSNYVVDRLIVDFYSTKGVNFNVYANAAGTGDPLEYHTSTVQTVDPDDGGMVYEYAINGTEWCINNTTSYKPGFYSITVVFTK